MILEQNHGSLVTGFTRSDMASINQEMQDLQEIQVLQEMARYPKHT